MERSYSTSGTARFCYSLAIVAWLLVGCIAVASSLYYAPRIDQFDRQWTRVAQNETRDTTTDEGIIAILQTSTTVLRGVNIIIAVSCGSVILLLPLFGVAARGGCTNAECCLFAVYWFFLVLSALFQLAMVAIGAIEIQIRLIFFEELSAYLTTHSAAITADLAEGEYYISHAEYTVLLQTARTLWSIAAAASTFALLLEGGLTALRERAFQLRLHDFKREQRERTKNMDTIRAKHRKNKVALEEGEEERSEGASSTRRKDATDLSQFSSTASSQIAANTDDNANVKSGKPAGFFARFSRKK